MSRRSVKIISLAALYTAALCVAINAAGWLASSDDKVFTGYTQRDQPSYYACARELFENGNGLFYANPYSLDPASPRIYTHLGIVLAGWLWRLAGIPFIVIDQAARFVFGTAMFALWAALARRFVHGSSERFWATAIGWTGAGIAWLLALFSGQGETYIDRFGDVEQWYMWWFCNLVRNVMFSTESFYHTLALATLLSLARGRWVSAGVFLSLTWWAHPFTGTEVGVITGLFFLISFGLPPHRMPWRAFASTTAITLAFVLYNRWWLPRWPEHQSVMELWRAFDLHFHTEDALPAHGLLLAISAPWLLQERAWRWILRTRAGRLWLAWLVGAWALSLNDHWLPNPVQPAHFTRGYEWLPLLVSAVRSVSHFLGRRPQARRVAFAALALTLLPDNALFLFRYSTVSARASLVTIIPRDDRDAIRFLSEQPGTETVAVLAPLPVWGPGYLLVTESSHRSLISHLANMPHAVDRVRLINSAWRTGDSRPLARAGVTIAVVPATGVDQGRPFRGGRVIHRNASWVVVDLRGSPR